MNCSLPIKDGVSPSSQWLPAGHWTTILGFLNERFPAVTLDTWTARMAKGELVDETGLRLNPASAYRVGACVFYYRELESETKVPFAEQILYQDEHLLVVDKPHFLPVIPSGRFLHETLLVRLKKKWKLEHLVPIHRLDRETAGVVLFSINSATRGEYTALFRNRRVRKVYEALAPALPAMSLPLTRRSRIVRGEPFFRMKESEGEPNSETHIDSAERAPSTDLEYLSSQSPCGVYPGGKESTPKSHGDTESTKVAQRRLKVGQRVMLYRLMPVTGCKHQLRLHMAALGMPIVNDRLYPRMSSEQEPDSKDSFSSPLKLLARSVSFEDPLTRREHFFQSCRTL